MDNVSLENIKTLLENYQKILEQKRINLANSMADWYGVSEKELDGAVQGFTTNRIELQRVETAIFDIENEL